MDDEAAVQAEDESFQTFAGFIVHAMDRLPAKGNSFTAGDFTFEILDMDRRRIYKVMIRRDFNSGKKMVSQEKTES